MKMIINGCYGGFGISDEALTEYGISDDLSYSQLRVHPELITAIEHGEDISDDCAELEVVEIPDEATDWMIQEYDGLESVIYVLNGKLHYVD